jgi:hypothetical protein
MPFFPCQLFSSRPPLVGACCKLIDLPFHLTALKRLLCNRQTRNVPPSWSCSAWSSFCTIFPTFTRGCHRSAFAASEWRVNILQRGKSLRSLNFHQNPPEILVHDLHNSRVSVRPRKGSSHMLDTYIYRQVSWRTLEKLKTTISIPSFGFLNRARILRMLRCQFG